MKLLLAAFLASVPVLGPAPHDVQVPPRTISVQGEATLYVAPDEVEIAVGIEVFEAELDTAKRASDERAALLLTALRERKIGEQHLRTDAVDVELRYKDDAPPALVRGYVVRRVYAITLKDVTQFESIVETALENGANQILGTEFRTTELRKHRDEARKQAAQAAREKAELLAGEFNCHAGKPLTISESWYGYASPNRRWWDWGSGRLSQNASQLTGSGSGGETAPLGRIGISASISATFELTP